MVISPAIAQRIFVCPHCDAQTWLAEGDRRLEQARHSPASHPLARLDSGGKTTLHTQFSFSFLIEGKKALQSRN